MPEEEKTEDQTPIADDVQTAAAEEVEKANEASQDAKAAIEATAELLEGINKLANLGENIKVTSFEDVGSCDEILYTWKYVYPSKDGSAKSYTFDFHAIPMKEYDAVCKSVQLPVVEEIPRMDADGGPIYNDDGTMKTRKMVNDPRYKEQLDEANRNRTLRFIEVSLQMQIPGDTFNKKFEWFEEMPLNVWRSMFNIVWGRLIGGGLVNFI